MMNKRGFTLIELMVALVMVGIIGMGAIRLFIAQHQAFLQQNDGVRITQNARAGFDMLVRELRNAGYDPRDAAGASITDWTSDSFGWTADLNADGDIADDGETVLYYYEPDEETLIRSEAGVEDEVADGITELDFGYFSDAAGTVAASATEIEQVGISMTYATPAGVMPGNLETQVALRNQIYGSSGAGGGGGEEEDD